MQPRQDEHYRTRVRVLKALAHPTRLFLVEELAQEERCVCDLTERVGDDISTVSKHLALLRKAGILSTRREGHEIYYRLETPCVLNIFQCVTTVLESDEEASSCNAAN